MTITSTRKFSRQEGFTGFDLLGFNCVGGTVMGRIFYTFSNILLNRLFDRLGFFGVIPTKDFRTTGNAKSTTNTKILIYLDFQNITYLYNISTAKLGSKVIISLKKAGYSKNIKTKETEVKTQTTTKARRHKGDKVFFYKCTFKILQKTLRASVTLWSQ